MCAKRNIQDRSNRNLSSVAQGSNPPKGPADAERLIIKALSNPKFLGRTIHGIAKEAQISEQDVLRAIKTDKSLARSIKVLPIRAKGGEVLITTKNRFISEASVREKFVDFFASNRPELDIGD